MKKIFNPNTAIIEYKGAYNIATLCTIYTEDDAIVTLCNPAPLPKTGQQVLKDSYYIFEGNLYKAKETFVVTDKLDTVKMVYYAIETKSIEWREGEKVDIGWQRVYKGETYQALQSHVSTKELPPSSAPYLWISTNQRPDVKPASWSDKMNYKTGTLLLYKDLIYVVLVDHYSDKAKTPDITPEWYKLKV